jgi:hypothetical protein
MSLWSIVAETWRNTPAPIKTAATAAFGLVIGAWLTGRAQAKRRMIEELNALRAATAVCFSITNRALSLKRQIVRPMKERHDQAVAAFQTHQKGLLELALDLQTVSQLKFPSDVLERLVFEKTNIGEKGLAVSVALSGAIDDLRNSIGLRNELISEFREQREKMTELQRIELYVGVPRTGEIDRRFGQNVQALYSQTDDCIFFSMLLADELRKYNNAVHSRNRFRFRLGRSKLLPADWTIAREAKLIPDESAYADWSRGFRRPPTTWERLVGWIKDVFRISSGDAPEPVSDGTRNTLGRAHHRRRSKVPHSTFIDHKKG